MGVLTEGILFNCGERGNSLSVPDTLPSKKSPAWADFKWAI